MIVFSKNSVILNGKEGNGSTASWVDFYLPLLESGGSSSCVELTSPDPIPNWLSLDYYKGSTKVALNTICGNGLYGYRLLISVNLNILSEGTHSTSLSYKHNNQTSIVSITVNITEGTPQFDWNLSNLVYYIQEGESIDNLPISVSNSGFGSLSYQIESPSYISIEPTFGSNLSAGESVAHIFQFNTTGLTSSNSPYQDNIVATWGNEQTSKIVTINVSSVSSFSISPTPLQTTFVFGTGSPGDQNSFTVRNNNGSRAIEFRIKSLPNWMNPLVSNSFFANHIYTLAGGESKKGTYAFRAFSAGTSSTNLEFEWKFTNETVWKTHLYPVSLVVTATQLISVNAGPDTTVSSGTFTRTGIVEPTSDKITTSWIGINHTLNNKGSGNNLIIDFPDPVDGFQDYEFEFRASCPYCSPTFLSDKCKIRVSNSTLNQISISPSQVDIDLESSLSQTVVFTVNTVPSDLNITKYTWSDDASNPYPLVSSSQANASIFLINNWPGAGTYHLNVEIETTSGIGVASATIVVTGEGSGLSSVSTDAFFANNDDIYNIEYFVLDTEDEELREPNEAFGFPLEQFEDLPPHTVTWEGKEVPVPSAHPSICSLLNNKRTGSGEQYLFLTYQAFVLYQWQIFLRQIRLSERDQKFPVYDSPYNTAGIVLNSDITDHGNSSSVVEVDYINNKVYNFIGASVFRSNFDGTDLETLYTFTDPVFTNETIQAIRIDFSLTVPKIYWSESYLSGATYVTRIYGASVESMLTKGTPLYSVNQTVSAVQINKIALSKDFVYFYENNTLSIWRTNRETDTSIVLIENASSYVSFDGNLNTNDCYLINSSTHILYKLSEDGILSEIKNLLTSAVVTISSTDTLRVDSTDSFIYIGQPSGRIIRFDFNGLSFGVRVEFAASNTLNRLLSVSGESYNLFWLELSGATYPLKSAPAYLDFSMLVNYIPIDFYIINFVDEAGIDQTVTRVVYRIETTNGLRKITKQDKYGYYNDLNLTITYEDNLSAHWYDRALFEFSDVLINTQANNLTNFPFDVATTFPYSQTAVFGDISDRKYWRLVDNLGNISFVENTDWTNFGSCGTQIDVPILMSSSSGHCTNPVIASNYNNDIFIAYEDTDNKRPQIKIIGTGDFCQGSPIGPHGSYFSDFYSNTDFSFTHSITEQEGLNQLVDMVVDKNNIIHLAWQSNRDNYWEIYYAKSDNGFAPTRITQSKSRSMNPSLAINDEGHIYIAFHDDRFDTKYEIMLAYKKENRILPLLQQNEYLSGFKNDYDHFMDRIYIPVTNSTNEDAYIQIRLNFYNNRPLEGSPVITVSTKNNPDLFEIESATASSGDVSLGIFVRAGQTEYIWFLGSSSTLNFEENQTYFVNIEFVYPNESVLTALLNYTYSCTYCNVESETRWTSSAHGFSDTRITFSTENSLRPFIKTRSSGKLVILWEDYRFEVTKPKILGATFDSVSSDIDLRSSGGTWFDYGYNIGGKAVSLSIDLFDRVLSSYELPKTSGTTTSLPQTVIGYKICDFKPIPKSEAAPETITCDYSNITTNLLTNDPKISSDYVKQLSMHPDSVDYYTRDVNGNSIPVVSDCEVVLDLIGTPEVIAYRVKNENEPDFPEWVPFKPDISNYYTQINHRLSMNPGIKEICVQVATYTGVTSVFSLLVVADYVPLPFEIDITEQLDSTEVPLPLYEFVPVASIQKKSIITLNVYIVIPKSVSDSLAIDTIPTFDFIQQGTNDIFDVNTIEQSTRPSVTYFDEPTRNSDGNLIFGSIDQISADGRVFKGTIEITSEDGRFNRDGVARIKPRFESKCIAEYSSFSSSVNTRDQFNIFGKPEVITTTIDNLSELRNPETGLIGIVPDAGKLISIPEFVNRYSMKFNGSYIRVNMNNSLPLYSNEGFSISVWFRLGSPTNQTGSIQSYLWHENPNLRLSLWDESGETAIYREGLMDTQYSTTKIEDSNWHHLAYVDHNGNASLYVDGVEDLSNFNYTPIDFSDASYVYIGGNGSFGASNVVLDELSAWNKALRPQEIVSIYNNGTPTDLSSETNLVLWYRFGDDVRSGVVYTESDSSNNNNYGILSEASVNSIVSDVSPG